MIKRLLLKVFQSLFVDLWQRRGPEISDLTGFLHAKFIGVSEAAVVGLGCRVFGVDSLFVHLFHLLTPFRVLVFKIDALPSLTIETRGDELWHTFCKVVFEQVLSVLEHVRVPVAEHILLDPEAVLIVLLVCEGIGWHDARPPCLLRVYLVDFFGDLTLG